MQVVKISHAHAACTRPPLPAFDVSPENVTFTLSPSLGPLPPSLVVYRSNFEAEHTILFERQEDIWPDQVGRSCQQHLFIHSFIHPSID